METKNSTWAFNQSYKCPMAPLLFVLLLLAEGSFSLLSEVLFAQSVVLLCFGVRSWALFWLTDFVVRSDWGQDPLFCIWGPPFFFNESDSEC